MYFHVPSFACVYTFHVHVFAGIIQHAVHLSSAKVVCCICLLWKVIASCDSTKINKRARVVTRPLQPWIVKRYILTCCLKLRIMKETARSMGLSMGLDQDAAGVDVLLPMVEEAETSVGV